MPWVCTDTKERFDCKYIQVPESGCWIWEARIAPSGYGIFWNAGKNRRAHRIAYELYREPIPEGMTLDHLCRVTCCVNPWHLEVVTVRENLRRGNGICAVNTRKTHCKYGHALDAINTLVRKPGERVCLTCKRNWDKVYRHTTEEERNRVKSKLFTGQAARI